MLEEKTVKSTLSKDDALACRYITLVLGHGLFKCWDIKASIQGSWTRGVIPMLDPSLKVLYGNNFKTL